MGAKVIVVAGDNTVVSHGFHRGFSKSEAVDAIVVESQWPEILVVVDIPTVESYADYLGKYR